MTTSHGGKRAGSGRKAGPWGIGVKISLMLPVGLHDRLVDAADFSGLTFSREIVRRLEYYENHPQPEDESE